MFNDEQIERYSRLIILPEVGGKGQKKLTEAGVLCLGAGGLGSPAALYLAAAGIGRLGIVDADAVDLSNLNRQVLHATADIGRPKVVSAREKLIALNPHVEIVAYEARAGVDNIAALVADYDVVLDGTDNFATRFLVNDACFFAGKPLCHGSIFRFEGQATTLFPGRGPCYRCLYPEPPPADLVPNCQQAGVFGAIAGIIGVTQAIEALKCVLGIGELLIGRLLVFDAVEMSFRALKFYRNPDCALCGGAPTITELVSYDESCQLAGTACPTAG